MYSQVRLVLFGLLTGIVNRSKMFSHGAGVRVVLVAAWELAFVWLCLNMGLDVLSSIAAVIESLWTTFISTGVRFFPGMSPHVQPHVFNTRKPSQTAWYGAFVWFLSSVTPQVHYQLVPSIKWLQISTARIPVADPVREVVLKIKML